MAHKRSMVLASLALLLGSAATTAQAAPTSPAPTPAPSAGCQPAMHVLPTVAGPNPTESGTGVLGLSLKDQIAVGQSEGLPVYWVGDVLHRVPLPKGYAGGSVQAVNRFGLMVGSLLTDEPDPKRRAFRYWAGGTSVALYPTITSATDVNDAGQVVGYAPDVDVVYVFGPGTRVHRIYPLPALYTLAGGIQINNAGFVLASGSYQEPRGGEAVDSFTWSPASSGPQPVLPTHTLGFPGSEQHDVTWRSTTASALDNRNRMVGYRFPGAGSPDGPASWSSLEATASEPLFQQINDAGGMEAILVALGDRSGVAAGTAVVQVDLRGGTVPGAGPETAVVWDGGSGEVVPLPPGGPSAATAAQDDGRVGGRAQQQGVWVPVVWTCALGR